MRACPPHALVALLALALALPAPAAAGPDVPLVAPAPPEPQRVFPVDGPVEWNEGFGTRGGAHKGIDLMADCGTPLVATGEGKVHDVREEGSAGKFLVMRMRPGRHEVFMHMQSIRVKVGQPVAPGQRLGSVGRTGNASACHLHFERWSAPGWYAGGEAVDPEPFLRRARAGR